MYGIIVLFILLLFLSPIFVPLFLWYIKKNRDSKIYKVARGFRILIAILILLTIVTIFNHKIGDPFEVMGAVLGKILIAYLLCKRWNKKSQNEDFIELDK